MRDNCIVEVTIRYKDEICYRAPLSKELPGQQASILLGKFINVLTSKFLKGELISLQRVYDGVNFTFETRGNMGKAMFSGAIHTISTDNSTYELSKFLDWLHDPKTLSS